MAQISIHIDGSVRVQDKLPGNDCLSIHMDKDLVLDDGYRHPIQRDTLYLHGDATELRAFAAAILGALPVQVQMLPEPSEMVEEVPDYLKPLRNIPEAAEMEVLPAYDRSTGHFRLVKNEEPC